MLNKNSNIFIAGHKGLVGSAIYQKLKLLGFKKIIIVEKKKLDFQREYGGDVDAKILIGAIIAVIVFALGTVVIIQEFF